MKYISYAGAGTLILLTVLAWFAVRDSLQPILPWFFAGLGVLILIGLVVALLNVAYRLLIERQLDREKLRQERGRTDIIQAEAATARAASEYSVVTSDGEVFIRETNPTAVWWKPGTDPRIIVSPLELIQRAPQLQELQTWLWKLLQGMPAQAAAAIAKDELAQLGAGQNGHHWPDMVRLWDLIPESGGDLDHLVFGVTLDDQGQTRPVTVALSEIVHAIIAGTTDSGKSNLARAIAYQVATARQQVKLAFIDPKRTFRVFDKCDRLLYPVVDQDDDALAVLIDLVRIAEERYALFPSKTVDNIYDYNRTVAVSEQLSFITVFIDEMTALLDSKKQANLYLRRLGLMARAAGVYIFGVGHGFTHKDLDSTLRAQFRTRIHLAATDPSSSRILLGSDDATKITERGRAITRFPFGMEIPGVGKVSQKLVEIQAPFAELSEVANHLPPGDPKIITSLAVPVMEDEVVEALADVNVPPPSDRTGPQGRLKPYLAEQARKVYLDYKGNISPTRIVQLLFNGKKHPYYFDHIEEIMREEAVRMGWARPIPANAGDLEDEEEEGEET